jgi:hypothetical protein
MLAFTLLPNVTLAEQGAVRNIPASHIMISNFNLYEQQQLGWSGQCVAFTNMASITAHRVLFLYSIVGSDGSTIYSAAHEAKGEFAPGALIQGQSETTCRSDQVLVGGGSVHYNGKAGSMVASVAEVDYADGTAWHAGPDIIGAALPQPEADVRITKSFSWEVDGATQECVSLTNAGSRTVRKIHLMFSHIADDGSDVVTDPFDVYQPYLPGASQTLACRGWNGSLSPKVGTAPDASLTPEILVFGKAARLVSWISEIDYTDGTAWHAPASQYDAVSAAAVPNKLDYSQGVWGPKTPEIAGSFDQQSASGIEITKTVMWDPGAPNECVTFVNRSAKPVKRVRFTFSHLGSDRAPLGDESMDSRPRSGDYEPGVAQEQQCRTFIGTLFLPSFWNGGNSDAQVTFKEQPSTLSVRVEEVEYEDGTLWRTTVP